MSGIRVAVTAEQIAVAGLLSAHDNQKWDLPVVQALTELTGQDVSIDADGDQGYVATIGQGEWTLVVDLPAVASAFLDTRWIGEGDGEPFEFDLIVPDWITALLARAVA